MSKIDEVGSTNLLSGNSSEQDSEDLIFLASTSESEASSSYVDPSTGNTVFRRHAAKKYADVSTGNNPGKVLVRGVAVRSPLSTILMWPHRSEVAEACHFHIFSRSIRSSSVSVC